MVPRMKKAPDFRSFFAVLFLPGILIKNWRMFEYEAPRIFLIIFLMNEDEIEMSIGGIAHLYPDSQLFSTCLSLLKQRKDPSRQRFLYDNAVWKSRRVVAIGFEMSSTDHNHWIQHNASVRLDRPIANAVRLF